MTTTDTLLFLLTLVAAFGCALVAGVFFAFSNFIMKALARIVPSSGMAAMQAINVTVINPGFLALFMGTAVICLGLAVAAIWRWPTPGARYLLIGSLLYVIGTFVVTMAFNVPRNDALARLDAADADAVTFWRDYVSGWTKWNHVRTLAALAAAASLVLAID